MTALIALPVGLLALIAVAPLLKRTTPRQWRTDRLAGLFVAAAALTIAVLAAGDALGRADVATMPVVAVALAAVLLSLTTTPVGALGPPWLARGGLALVAVGWKFPELVAVTVEGLAVALPLGAFVRYTLRQATGWEPRDRPGWPEIVMTLGVARLALGRGWTTLPDPLTIALVGLIVGCAGVGRWVAIVRWTQSRTPLPSGIWRVATGPAKSAALDWATIVARLRRAAAIGFAVALVADAPGLAAVALATAVDAGHALVALSRAGRAADPANKEVP
jgi:hypothetical protein